MGVTIQIFVVPGKPVGNLALRMFQRYFARMANALEECPGVVANDLYSNHLIARETVNKVHFTLGLTPHDKATILLMAVEPSIADSKSDKALRQLCEILSKHPNMERISNCIMKRYGKLYTYTHTQIFWCTFINFMLYFVPFGILKDLYYPCPIWQMYFTLI